MDLNMTERNRKFRQRLIDTLPNVCAERAVIWTQSYKENEDQPPILKAALALRDTLQNMTIRIYDEDLLVGNQGNGLRAATLSPTVNTWFEAELDTFEARDGSRFTITPQAKQQIREILPYWKGKTVYESTMAILGTQEKEAMECGLFTCGYTLSKGCGHWLLNIENVLKNGFETFQRQAEQKLEQLDYSDAQGVEKIPFYRSIVITCEAVKAFARRYSDLAREMVRTAEPERAQELQRIAEVCARVPYKAPQNFYEALQTVYFVQLLTHIESDGTGISLGRLDYMLYPFYKRDIEEGTLDKEFARELLDALWLKIASIIQIWNAEDSKAFGGHPVSQAVTLGGQDEQGRDATNELSHLMLETTARVHMPQPSVCVRVSRSSPQDFLMLCAEVIREGLGMPAMYNDDIAIPSLTMRGIDLKEARRHYGVIGCVEMGVQGKLCAFANSGYYNLVKALELALNGGGDPMTGKQIGPKTPEQPQTFEEFKQAYFEQVDSTLKYMVSVTNVVDTMHPRILPLPFVSAITDDCIEKGVEVQSGGARYNYDGIQGVGLADVADSMAAIKQLVFEEKSVTWMQLKEALRNNFEGAEELRMMLVKRVPKYGNNIAEADVLAREVAQRFSEMVERYKNPRGGFFIPGMYSNSANVPLGEVCGATPNGRFAKAPIAEACSPSHHCDRSGCTQAALSVAKLDHLIMTNGSQYNQKFHPTALAGEKGLRSLVQLIQTYFEAGGYHIQFNVVSADTLRKAQKNPDEHRDLVVRVAGYTAFFTDLDHNIQNDIIDRTEMDFA